MFTACFRLFTVIANISSQHLSMLSVYDFNRTHNSLGKAPSSGLVLNAAIVVNSVNDTKAILYTLVSWKCSYSLYPGLRGIRSTVNSIFQICTLSANTVTISIIPSGNVTISTSLYILCSLRRSYNKMLFMLKYHLSVIALAT